MQPEVADQRFREMYRATERDVLAYFLRRTDATSARDGAAETAHGVYGNFWASSDGAVWAVALDTGETVELLAPGE